MNSVIILIISLIAGAVIGYLFPKKSSESKIYEHDIESLKQRIQEINNLLDTEKEAKLLVQGDFNKCKEDLFEKNTKYDSLNAQFNDIVTQKRLVDQEKQHLLEQLQASNNDYADVKAKYDQILELRNSLQIEKEGLNTRISQLDQDKSSIQQRINQFEASEQNRVSQYEANMTALNGIKNQIVTDRENELIAKQQLEIDRLNNLKETWSLHQSNVKSNIQNISKKHIIEYVTEFPHKGEPDNCLKICDEFVVLDAKSPASTDNMSNFPTYLKAQAENAKKYAKLENVKKDIFFVVPTNTLEILTQFVYNMADYTVYIISLDSLEQIILGLKKIEEYEFAKELSPEDRDNICRVIGKFAHLTKRRIQIDSFFAKQFIELAYKTESDLPLEIMEKVKEYEKAEKLNPPVERRVKAIQIKDLDKELNTIEHEAAAKGIVFDSSKMSEGLNDVPLYTNQSDEV
jgi:hypothetical protein